MFEKIKTRWQSNPNKNKILLFGGIGIALVFVALLASNLINGPRRQFENVSPPGGFQTEAADVGVLADTVAATGSIEAGQLAILNWKTTGIVEEVNVAEGQEVQRGDTLATLQLNSLPQEVISAQGDLLEAQQTFDDFYASFEGVALAEAQKAVADAQSTYEDALYKYNSLLRPADDIQVEDAYAEVVFASDPLERALEEYKRFASRSQDNANRARAVQALADAQSVYDAAVREYNALAGFATDTEIAIAAADLAVAQATFNDAQAEYERLLAGPTDEEIAAAEADVAAAQAALNQRLIKAPFDGIVTLAKPQVGDYVATDEEAFELQNPSTYFVEIEVNELDINQIQVGQTANVVLDAMTDVTYSAEVAKVGSIGDDSSGVVTFTVVVEILVLDDQIKSGMTAVVEIETSTGEESLLIPNQAVRLEDGRQVVYVMGPNGTLLPVDVTLGASSTTHSELVGGNIQEGDLIVLNPPTETQNGPGQFFFTPGGGAGPGGGGPGGGGFNGGPGDN